MQDNNVADHITIEIMCYCECSFSGPVIGTYSPEDFRWKCPNCSSVNVESRYGDRGKHGDVKFDIQMEEENCIR